MPQTFTPLADISMSLAETREALIHDVAPVQLVDALLGVVRAAATLDKRNVNYVRHAGRLDPAFLLHQAIERFVKQATKCLE